MTTLSKDVWLEVRKLWEAGATYSLLSKKYGVSRQTIQKRSVAQQWQRSFRAENGGARRDGSSGVQESASVEKPAASPDAVTVTREQLVKNHQAAWRDVLQFQAAAFDVLTGKKNPLLTDVEVYSGGDNKGEPVLDDNGNAVRYEPTFTLTQRMDLSSQFMKLFETAVSALKTAQEGERRAHGFDYKMLQEQAKKDPEERRRRAELTDQILLYFDKCKRIERDCRDLVDRGDEVDAPPTPGQRKH